MADAHKIQFSENLWLTHDPWKYGEYLCIFPSKIGIIYALKWKLGTPCNTSTGLSGYGIHRKIAWN